MNVALNRPSWLSSRFYSATYGTREPSKGNDGDKTNCNAEVYWNSVAGSGDNELNPWYGVDLGVPLHVAGVRLTNREHVSYGKVAITSKIKHAIKQVLQDLHNCCTTVAALVSILF